MITPRIDKMEGVKTPPNVPNLLAVAKFLGICETTKDIKKLVVASPLRLLTALRALVVG